MRVRRGYVIRYARDAEGWWVGEVRGVAGVYSQGRTVEQTRSRVIEALAAFLDADVSAVEFEDEIHLPSAAQRALATAMATAEKSKTLAARAEEARVRAVRVLTDSGLSTRDVGRLLGVSRQRAHQLGRSAS